MLQLQQVQTHGKEIPIEEERRQFKCDKEGYIAKDCKGMQSMKKRKIQEESDDEDDNKKEQDFGNNLE